MKLSKLTVILLCAIATTITTTSCLNSDDDGPMLIIDPVETPVKVDADHVVSFISPEKISKADFNKSIVGRCWKNFETHEVTLQGEYIAKNYWQDRLGSSPEIYMLDKDSITTFYVSDAHMGRGEYRRNAYTYNETDNGVYVGGKRLLQVLPPFAQYMYAVEALGVRSDGTPIYGISNFEELSAFEYQNLLKNYTRVY